MNLSIALPLLVAILAGVLYCLLLPTYPKVAELCRLTYLAAIGVLLLVLAGTSVHIVGHTS